MLAELIAKDPTAAARLLRAHGYTVSKKRAKPKAETRPPGMSEGAWAWTQAVRRAKTYDALGVERLRKAARRMLDKEPPKPNPTFRAWIPYLPPYDGQGTDPHAEQRKFWQDAVIEWQKMGVDPSAIRYETPEENVRRQRRSEVASKVAELEYVAGEIRSSLKWYVDNPSRMGFSVFCDLSRERIHAKLANSRATLRACMDAQDWLAARRLVRARRMLRTVRGELNARCPED